MPNSSSGHGIRIAAWPEDMDLSPLAAPDEPPPPDTTRPTRLLPSFSLLTLLIFAAATPAAARGRAAPAPDELAFTLPTASGTISLASLRGKVVLVDFWASWCVPCRRSFPWLESHHSYAALGLRIVAIDLDKERGAAAEFLERYPASFTVAFDPAGKTADAFGVRAMPSSFLIDSTGVIISTHAGFDPRDTTALAAEIREVCSR